MNIVLIGSGKVSRVLGHALKGAGHRILMVCGRNRSAMKKLADELAVSSGNVDKVPPEADLYVLAVSDDSIRAVSEDLPAVKGIVAHCSGSRSINEISSKHSLRGIFYPLDSFSDEPSQHLKNTPILIEGDRENILHVLQRAASSVSDHVVRMTSDQREQVHVTAVFYNNFIYHLSSRLRERLSERSIDPSIFNKLISTTLQNIITGEPHQRQTGPAARNDKETIEHHLELLKDDSELSEIYNLITKQILKRKRRDDKIQG